MKANKLGLTLALLNFVLVFGIAVADGLLWNFTTNPIDSPSETRFLTWMIVINLFPFFVYGPVAKVPLLNWFYFKTYWTTCLHFAILGGIQWYLIGWGISSLVRVLFRKKEK